MLYLDCEFNGHNGHLISMGIVSDIDNDEFYEVKALPFSLRILPWVQENVIPILNKPPIQDDKFRQLLQEFLLRHRNEPIMADSPADFRYLLDYMHEIKDNKYRYLSLELTMEFVIPDRKKFWPENPLEHNALSDAKTLMAWDKSNNSYSLGA